MLKTEADGLILPPGSAPRIQLAGDTQVCKILDYGSWEAWVEYPDGHRRHHQAADVTVLMQKIAGQLKTRYNIDSFSFMSIPKSISTGETVTVGEIKYG